VTASDFHKAIRKISETHITQMPQLQVNVVAKELSMDSPSLRDHLHTLQTLGLIKYYDDQKEIFSLTESGWLANLP
jgi:Mn-dependent DtxR family transcriptional regulator